MNQSQSRVTNIDRGKTRARDNSGNSRRVAGVDVALRQLGSRRSVSMIGNNSRFRSWQIDRNWHAAEEATARLETKICTDGENHARRGQSFTLHCARLRYAAGDFRYSLRRVDGVRRLIVRAKVDDRWDDSSEGMDLDLDNHLGASAVAIVAALNGPSSQIFFKLAIILPSYQISNYSFNIKVNHNFRKRFLLFFCLTNRIPIRYWLIIHLQLPASCDTTNLCPQQLKTEITNWFAL